MDEFDADLYVKGMKETTTGIPCRNAGCFGDTSEWDQEVRAGECAECFWGRGPVAHDATSAPTVMAGVSRR